MCARWVTSVQCVGTAKSRYHYHFIKRNLFLPFYIWRKFKHSNVHWKMSRFYERITQHNIYSPRYIDLKNMEFSRINGGYKTFSCHYVTVITDSDSLYLVFFLTLMEDPSFRHCSREPWQTIWHCNCPPEVTATSPYLTPLGYFCEHSCWSVGPPLFNKVADTAPLLSCRSVDVVLTIAPTCQI